MDALAQILTTAGMIQSSLDFETEVEFIEDQTVDWDELANL